MKSTLGQMFSGSIAGLLLSAIFSIAVAGQETVLVGGATGRQGNAVVDELLKRGYAVRGLTRSPDGKKALALKEKGVEIVKGDYGDPDSLLAAMQGVSKMFFYSGFSLHEVEEGTNVVAAARESGIKHLVYSSGAAADPANGVKEAKKMQVELEIVASGLPYTVFRPVAFMENYDRQQKRIFRDGIVDSRAPDRMLHFIAIPDIGLLVAEAIDHPDEWADVAINVASDRMTVEAMVQIFSTVMGQEISYKRMPLDEYLQQFPKPLRPLFRWYDEVGYEADVEGLRKKYPQLTTLEEYLRASGWENWRPAQ
ncbi:MAG: NmrA/HSCARG family protein [Gammaproteobacteria bacterium]